MSGSIGIIGGADGPTAIFLTGSWDWVIALIAVLAAAILIFIIKKRR